MKTLTEFPSFNLKNAVKVKHDLTTAGKTVEELPAALGETLKLEGDKLTFLLTSLELVEKKLEDLKRVVVFSLSENEKAPAQAVQKGEHYFLVEYYPTLNRNKDSGRPEKDRKGRRGGKKGDRDRNKRGRGNPRGDRDRPNPAPSFGESPTTDTNASGTPTPPRENKRFRRRPPRPPAVLKGPDGRPIPTPGIPPKIIAPKIKINAPAAAASSEAPATAEEKKAE